MGENPPPFVNCCKNFWALHNLDRSAMMTFLVVRTIFALLLSIVWQPCNQALFSSLLCKCYAENTCSLCLWRRRIRITDKTDKSVFFQIFLDVAFSCVKQLISGNTLARSHLHWKNLFKVVCYIVYNSFNQHATVKSPTWIKESRPNGPLLFLGG